MLKANGWRAVALTGLVVGLTYSPALGDTRVDEFMRILKSGWQVSIRPVMQNSKVVSIKIINKRNENQTITVPLNNSQVASDDIGKVYDFLDDKKVPLNDKVDYRAELLLQAMPFYPTNPGPVTDGIRLQNGPDDSTILGDQRGTKLGRIPKGASMADKEDVVTSVVAQRSANGLISTRQRVLPASNPYLKQTADMVREDIEIAQNQLRRKLEQDAKDGAVLIRLSNVQAKVLDALGSKSMITDPSMDVTVLKQACTDNKFTYVPPDQDGWFTILDPGDNNEVIAVGQLTANGKVDAKNLDGLNRQLLDRPRLMNQIVRDTPEEVRSGLEAAAQEVKRYVDSESKSELPPEPTKKGPDPENPNGENGGGGNLLR